MLAAWGAAGVLLSATQSSLASEEGGARLPSLRFGELLDELGELSEEEMPSFVTRHWDKPHERANSVQTVHWISLAETAAAEDESEHDLPSLASQLDELESAVRELTEARATADRAAAERPSSRFTMQLQADQYAIDQDAVNVATVGLIPDGTVFRRARVGWVGDWELTEYSIQFDFALPGRPSFLDVWAGLKDVPVVGFIRVGHFFEPFSLERLTPNRYVTFMERNLADQPFVPSRNMGIIMFDNAANERMTWAIGAFAPKSDAFGNDVGVRRGEAITGRVTWLPYWEYGGRHYVHLGMAGSLRKPDEDEVQFAAQPEARLGAATPNVPNFVDTGPIDAGFSMLGGLEVAWIHGPFSVQAEYMVDTVDRIGASDVTFDGWYVQASYFLTGEHRPYKRTMPSGGVFDRVMPNRDFCLASRSRPRGWGWGAWEVATRVSHLDLNSQDVQGGELTNLTFGLNWYMTPYLRLTSNYVRAMLDAPVRGRSNADIFGMRIGYDF